MTYLTYTNFYFIVLPTITLHYVWFFFFKNNKHTLKLNRLDKITQPDLIGFNNNNHGIYVYFYTYITILYTLNFLFIYGKNCVLWFEHLIVTNFLITTTVVFFFLNFFLVFLLLILAKKNNQIKGIDYLFSLLNLVILLPYLYFSSTIFTFLFFVEIVSFTLLYKLISSQIWFKTQNLNKLYKSLTKQTPTNYINMLFFQYWVMFFSTIFIVYFYINIFYIYGSSNWITFQFLEKFYKNKQLFVDLLFKSILFCIFLISIFFKLGVTPYHLFKIEIYKGISLLSILFYTTYYFAVFFIFFVHLLSEYLNYFIPKFYALFSSSVLFGSCYVIFFLFDLHLLKAFFTYSTVINTIGLLLLLVVLLSI